MSMRRTVILTAVSASNFNRNKTATSSSNDAQQIRRNQTNYDGGLRINMHDNVNVVLAGAVLSATIAFVCVLCYCCNRSINKRSMTIYQQRWMEGLNDPNMGIYSVEQFYDSTTSHATPNTLRSQGEPPSYEAVMKLEKHFGGEKHPSDGLIFQSKPCQNCGSALTKDSHYSELNPSTEPELIDFGIKEVVESNEGSTEIYSANQSDVNANVNDYNGSTFPNINHNGDEASEASDRSTGCDTEMNSDKDNAMRIDHVRTTTSSDMWTEESCANCAAQISDRANNNTADFDHLNGNGIVRMDMSKIIDSTGLPTYDAALKLESCGYV